MHLIDYVAKHQLSSNAFARKAGLTGSVMSRLLTAQRRPKFETMMRISKATGGQVGRVEDFDVTLPKRQRAASG
jgi:DNA-binding phage protein